MRRETDTSKNAHEKNSGDQDPSANTAMTNGNENRFFSRMKKVGFTVWLAVMVIGGALAFLVALFLV